MMAIIVNDIAWCKTMEPFDFDSTSPVTPACLPERSYDSYHGIGDAWVSGYGATDEKHAHGTKILQSVKVPDINDFKKDCQHAYSFYGIMYIRPQYHICMS